MSTKNQRSLRQWRMACLALALSATVFSCAPNAMMARKVGQEFKRSAVLKQYQVGFALYDKARQAMIFEKDADKYFTPASNTKLFTFYAGLKISPDSIPALRYIERGDSLIFWGTGDPSFLHTQLKDSRAFQFLKNSGKQLFFAPGRYTGDFYGNGWQWDDYNAYYQAEINELPLMDNEVQIDISPKGGVTVFPPSFAFCLLPDSSMNRGGGNVQREFNTNVFHVPDKPLPAKLSQQIPYKVSTATTLELLIDTLKLPVGLVQFPMPADAKRLYGINSDAVFRQMLQPSDNFIAEQLLLTYADQAGIEMNTSKIIAYIEKKYLQDLPDKIRWVDGSGLSRGNLFTPRDIIALLNLIDKEVGDEQRLFGLLPAGGKTGTLRTAYPKTEHPFVFGKTGSLSNNHNQSGYVVTNKGRVLFFSFMNNNFLLPTADVRKEMVRIMTYIHEKF